MNDIEILVTGLKIMKGGIRGTEPVVEEIIKNANNEIQLVAYLFTPSATHILELIKKAAERGVNIIFVINDIESQNEIIRNELKEIANKYSHFKLYNFKDPQNKPLHAKIVIADRKKALVGSANFSWSGMYANYEIGVLINGKSAWKLAQVVDSLTLVSTLIETTNF